MVNSKKPASIKENLISHKRKTDFRSDSSPVNRILYLQRTIGNQAVQRIVRSGALQANLRIGQPGDVYEQEADRVADAVMRMPEPGVQRQVEPEEEEEERLQAKPLANQITPLVQVQRQEEPEEEEEERLQAKPLANQITPLVQVQRQEETEEEEEETLQAKPLAEEITPLVQRQVEPEEEEEELQAKATSGNISDVNPHLESQIQSLKGGGQHLSENDRTYFEPRFGADFSGVRVHSDSKANHLARSINAKAFTIGQDVVFGSGQYSPGSPTGRSLLAHEMTHVVQQSSAKTKGNSSSVIRREPARTPTYITNIYVDLSTQAVSWVYSDGARSASHLTSTGAGICQNDRSVCHSGNTSGTACTPVGGPFPVTGNRSPHRYRHFIDFGRPSIGFHYYRKVDGCPWSHGCVRLRRNAIDLLHSGVVTVGQARTRPGVTSTQVWVSGQPYIVRCWTTANGGRCYIRNATGRGRTRRRCAKNDCFPMGDFPIPDMSDQATQYA